MAKNIYSLQLLRNGSIFSSYEAAVDAITGSSVQDGVIKLARYNGASVDSGNTKYSTDVVKTVFGIYAAMEGNSGWTIFDSYHEIIVDLQRQIDAMGGDSGSIAEQIQAAINALDYDSYETGDSKVVVNVTETDGVVAATGENIANIKLADYTKGDDAGKVAATDTLGQALSKLEKQLEVVSANTADVISGLDYSDSAVAGEYVSQVTETDGVIAVTRVALPSLAEVHEDGKPIIAVSEDKGQLAASAGTINAEYVNVADARELFSSSTVEATLAEIVDKYTAADAALKAEILGDASESGNTLGELEDRIEALATDAKEYHIVKTTTGLPETIKERYSLVDAAGNVSGDTVDIPKDSHIVSITYDGTTQKLTYNYIDASGNTQSTDVDMSELVLETEFGSGVTVTDHVAHGVVDPTSETFLTVGADGFKLAGVQDAIDAAVSGASDELQDAIDELSGKAVTSIASADGSVTATPGQAADGTVSYDLSTDASKVKVSSAYTAGTDTAIATGDTVDAALAKLEAQIAAAKAAATVVEKDTNASHITLSSTTGSDGETIYTIGESDIASESDLDAEIAARKAVDGQTGQTYAPNASANYISGASDLNDADVKLDTAIKAVADAAGDVQNEVDAIETAVGLNADGTYNANTSNTYTNDATSVADAVDKLDAAVKDNADDIAELSGKSVTSVTVNGVEVVSNNAAPIVLGYTNEAASSGNGMVITTNESTGAMDIKFGTLDCGEY